MMNADDLKAHCDLVAKQLARGRVVVFFGAGVNLAGRGVYAPTHNLPSGAELAARLAATVAYPVRKVKAKCTGCSSEIEVEEPFDLMRVAQFVEIARQQGFLYDELRDVLTVDGKPGPVHQLCADMPALLASRGYPDNPLLIVTTNYDDMMERAFSASTPPQTYDLLAYDGKRRLSSGAQGNFWHRDASGVWREILEPNKESAFLTRLPVVFKIHGAFVREESERDSYVITEDDYTDYRLPAGDIEETVPLAVAKKLKTSDLLFLGYGLRDWNLRVIFRRIWAYRPVRRAGYAVQFSVDAIDLAYWGKWGVTLLATDLESYVAELRNAVARLPPR